MKRSWVFLGMFLSGCTTSATPNFYNGHYYMTGDADCTMLQGVSTTSTQIACFNSKDQVTGYRDPMTDQQLMIYQQAQAQRSQALAARAKTVPAIQYPTMTTPQVTPIVPPGGNQVRCIGVGIYTNCRAY